MIPFPCIYQVIKYLIIFFLRSFQRESFMNHIVTETNRYSAQKNGSKPLEITILDIKRYIGICMVIGYVICQSSKHKRLLETVIWKQIDPTNYVY